MEGKVLVLTGWGAKDYSLAAAAALRAFEGADVLGVSKRRLPLLLEDLDKSYGRVFILGVSLGGDIPRLAEALRKLKDRNVSVTWISAFAMPEDVREAVEGLFTAKVCGNSILDAVKATFGVNVSDLAALNGSAKRQTAAVRDFNALIDAAQFTYRNYQDETLFARAVSYVAKGVVSEAWAPEVRAAVAHYDRYGGRELIGRSEPIQKLQDRINRVAKHDTARVLILGESGTGKETVAIQIHNKSPRATGPFVAFNCASIASELLEDRFFGHEKGAFTGATERTDGLFALADGGTLFLDEIGEMAVETQALLLRVLEGGRFMRVGGRDEIKCDVRLVTATNRDLPALVRDGRFRADLYQRLNVVQLRTPSLREHKADIPIIANAWWRRNHGGRTLSQEQLDALLDYDYPGNVRELLNILDRATALEEDDFALIMREHKEMNAALSGATPAPPPVSVETPFPDELAAAMRIHVANVYERCGRNLTHAAAALGITRNTLRKYL